MYKNKYEINVLINGKPAREFYHNNRFYVEGRDGSEYTIKLKNHGHKKAMVVLSVDGIEVLKGGQAKDAESGYIVNPFSSIEIKGYRIDDNKVATFKFSDGTTSYATQVEQKFDPVKIEEVKKGEIAPAQNNGVIGVRIWEEKDAKVIPTWKTTDNNNYTWYYPSHNNISLTFTPQTRSYMQCSISGGNAITGCMAGLNLSGYSSDVINVFCYSGVPAPKTRGTFVKIASGGMVGGSNSSTTKGRNRQIYQTDLLYVGPSHPEEGNGTLDASLLNNVTNVGHEWIMPLTDVNQFGELSAISSASMTPNFELGTTWGKQQEDKVVKVKFNKEDTYIDMELFYITREEMKRIGIDLENTKKIFVSGFPKAFGEKEEYCKQPVDWKE